VQGSGGPPTPSARGRRSHARAPIQSRRKEGLAKPGEGRAPHEPRGARFRTMPPAFLGRVNLARRQGLEPMPPSAAHPSVPCCRGAHSEALLGVVFAAPQICEPTESRPCLCEASHRRCIQILGRVVFPLARVRRDAPPPSNVADARAVDAPFTFFTSPRACFPAREGRRKEGRRGRLRGASSRPPSRPKICPRRCRAREGPSAYQGRRAAWRQGART